MRRSPVRRFVAVVLVATALAACTGAADSGGGDKGGSNVGREGGPRPEDMAADQTLRVHAFFRPPTFDPSRQPTGARGGNGLGRQYTEALLKPTPGVDPEKLDVMGAAATSYQVSPDGLTYTFRLREDAKFNDGRPVKADDFVYGWRRVIDPRLATPFGQVFASVVKGGEKAASLGPEADRAKVESALDDLGLRAVDDRTFEVSLAYPAAYFKWIATLHQGAPIRRDVVEKHGSDTWATKAETLVTNGPFKVSEMAANATTLVADRYHWEKPLLTKIVATHDVNLSSLWFTYLSNELDVSNGPPTVSSYLKALKDPPLKDEVLQFLELSTNWLQFNAAKAPFDNPLVRLAFAQAVDRKTALEVYEGLIGSSLTTLIPRGIPGHDPEAGPQEFDAAKAKATLQASGVDRAQFEDIKILTGPAQETDATFFVEQFDKHLGIKLGIERVGDTINSRVANGDFNLRTTFQGHSALYPDPQDFFDVFLSDSRQNESKWKNPDYDRLVRQANATTDQAERVRLYGQAQTILAEQAPAVFTMQPNRFFWIKPWVRGIARTPVDTAFLPGDIHSTKIWIARH